jgi:hypothetical protein
MEVLMATTRSSDDTPDDTPDQAERERIARVAVRRTGVAVVVGGLLVAITVLQSFVAWAASTADEHNYCSPGPQFAVLDATLHVEWLLALVVLIGAGCGAFLAVLGAREAGQARERLGAMAGVELVVTLLAFAVLVLFAAGYTFLLPYKCGL